MYFVCAETQKILFPLAYIACESGAQVSLHAESRRLRAENQQTLHRMAEQREESRTNTAVVTLLDAIDTMRLPVEPTSDF